MSPCLPTFMIPGSPGRRRHAHHPTQTISRINLTPYMKLQDRSRGLWPRKHVCRKRCSNKAIRGFCSSIRTCVLACTTVQSHRPSGRPRRPRAVVGALLYPCACVSPRVVWLSLPRALPRFKLRSTEAIEQDPQILRAAPLARPGLSCKPLHSHPADTASVQ